MILIRGIRLFLPAAAIITLVAACSLGQSAPVSFYALTPSASPVSNPSMNDGLIAVQTVRLPEYLNQRGIVTRTHGEELSVASTHQWAGPLDTTITEVLVGNLRSQLGPNRVLSFPVNPAVPLAGTVQVEISRFDATADGQVTLIAQWLVFDQGGRRFLAADGGHYATTVEGGGYGAIAAAMSRLLAEMSDDIARLLTNLPMAARAAS